MNMPLCEAFKTLAGYRPTDSSADIARKNAAARIIMEALSKLAQRIHPSFRYDIVADTLVALTRSGPRHGDWAEPNVWGYLSKALRSKHKSFWKAHYRVVRVTEAVRERQELEGEGHDSTESTLDELRRLHALLLSSNDKTVRKNVDEVFASGLSRLEQLLADDDAAHEPGGPEAPQPRGSNEGARLRQRYQRARNVLLEHLDREYRQGRLDEQEHRCFGTWIRRICGARLLHFGDAQP